ncbi:hypothetical protein A3B56_00760 [Candidatus Roizmanbacteria bacterium RIFCSPLOWO2_01_FULL_45_11]|uniref:Uncharacterized protein n=1 Tax=Candidatus Roizmanbacteria bacterium RIFCSPLOWO2_01_FULL_45_11 TaxID=1802070 RepID=A0A1F7JGW5_9BACT|nr:MAG: hypothetical protein A3B56_00760 [Candidatus Roizmanbacteria bacterium RIFCSPLOWO2_01_FULL_45_11]
MKYLYLSVLAFLAAMTLEYFSGSLVGQNLPEATYALVVVLMYIISGIFIIATVATSKLKQEPKLILYLVTLTILTLKALNAFRMIS